MSALTIPFPIPQNHYPDQSPALGELDTALAAVDLLTAQNHVQAAKQLIPAAHAADLSLNLELFYPYLAPELETNPPASLDVGSIVSADVAGITRLALGLSSVLRFLDKKQPFDPADKQALASQIAAADIALVSIRLLIGDLEAAAQARGM